jgi:hypothetical protein
MIGWIQLCLALGGIALLGLLYLSILPMITPAFRKNIFFGLLVLLVPIVGGLWLMIREDERNLNFYENLFVLVFFGGYAWMVIYFTLQALIQAGIL